MCPEPWGKGLQDKWGKAGLSKSPSSLNKWVKTTIIKKRTRRQFHKCDLFGRSHYSSCWRRPCLIHLLELFGDVTQLVGEAAAADEVHRGSQTNASKSSPKDSSSAGAGAVRCPLWGNQIEIKWDRKGEGSWVCPGEELWAMIGACQRFGGDTESAGTAQDDPGKGSWWFLGCQQQQVEVRAQKCWISTLHSISYLL